MKTRVCQCYPQPLTGIAMSALAGSLLLSAWLTTAITLKGSDIPFLLAALFLSGAVILAGKYPIHIQRNVKVFFTTVPLYVIAMLFPPAVAALLAGISLLALQFLTRVERGNLPIDIATAVGRWVIIVFVSGWLAHEALSGPALLVTMLSAALAMFSFDMLTGALEIAAMSGEPPLRILTTLVREASLAESAQYLLGILATLAAWQELWSLLLWVLPLWMFYYAFKHAKEMHEGTSNLLESMADAVDLRDPYTGGHSRRVTAFVVAILDEMKIVGPEAELIRSAARVHDIGKIGIPDHILNKPGQLTPEEKHIMDSHPERGAELLTRYKDFVRGMDIVRHHHERWDGMGYPAGLKGMDIPFGARVIAVADSFDAMTSNRPYRSGMPTTKAAQILHEGRDSQWQSDIVDAFLRYVALEQLRSAVPVNEPHVLTVEVPVPSAA